MEPRLAGAWLLSFAVVAATPATLEMQERVDLTGEWTLNAELSGQATERSRDERVGPGRRSPVGGSGMPIGGMGGGRAPGGMGGGSAGGGGNTEEIAKAREATRLAMLTPARLTIVAAANGFTVTDEDGVSQKWIPDGKTTKSESGALTVETKVKWDDRSLVVERKFEGGVKVTDRYTVTGAPRQLVIASRIENSRIPGERDRTLQRVYDSKTK
jgi:hypothetical protein